MRTALHRGLCDCNGFNARVFLQLSSGYGVKILCHTLNILFSKFPPLI
jgi:hypothetical protein